MVVFQVRKRQVIRYTYVPLSPLSAHRLSVVKRKILVLDLDETLIHSHHDGIIRPMVKPGTPPDFVLRVKLFLLTDCLKDFFFFLPTKFFTYIV
ncbi:unnamed protein product [Onchocerca flexuosa]|uniref:FCP1 homology domain-containing protein n=1 Tax=Onchocerca flexuosa TaxID=387005 RepID=A0A183I637_9BILA|nr:unnamed protein product [Onchocerca flexuosa]